MNISTQFERLHRHFLASSKTYDKVSLLDLSHSLRIWTDLKKTISVAAPEFAKSIAFNTCHPSKYTVRATRGREFVYCLFSGSVVTHASQGHIASLPAQEHMRDGEVIAQFRLLADGGLEVASYFYVAPSIEMPIIQLFQGQGSKRCNFVQWMDSRAVIGAHPLEDGTLAAFSLSHEELICRVANEFDGSHPQGLPVPKFELEASRAAKYLWTHSVAGLPLPYYLLLKDAGHSQGW